MNINWVKRTGALFMVAAAGIAFTGPEAEAGSTGNSFTVTGVVTSSCAATFNNLSINYVSGQSGSVNAGETVTVSCTGVSSTNQDPTTLTFTTTSGSYAMKGGISGNTDTLTYNLCSDATCATPSSYTGSGVYAQGATNSFSLASNSETIPLYLVVAGGQSPAADTYSQSVTATLTF